MLGCRLHVFGAHGLCFHCGRNNLHKDSIAQGSTLPDVGKIHRFCGPKIRKMYALRLRSGRGYRLFRSVARGFWSWLV